MEQTKEQLVYQVINNLLGGTKGVSNHPFSIEQIGDEIDNLRVFLLKNSSVKPDYELFYQSVTCAEVVRVSAQECMESDKSVLRTKQKVPTLLSVKGKLVNYIGASDWSFPYHVLSTHQLVYRAYKKYASADAVYRDGYFYLYGVPENTQYVAIRGLFESPTLVASTYPCCKDERYPVSGDIATLIIKELIERYKTYGYFSMPQPNTQTHLPAR